MTQELDISFLESHGLQFIDMAGKGGYGCIFLVYSTKYNQNFALKKVKAKYFRQSEIDCMRMLDNSSIVPLYDYYFFNEFVYLLMEFCPSSLDRELKNKGPFIGDELIKTAYGMLKAIKSCHENKVAHNDIKPSNFLIDAYGRIKVCDFGLSSFIQDDLLSSLYAGSKAFLAPEVISKKPFDSFKADIWALGVSLYILATSHLPWSMKSEKHMIASITTGNVDY